MFVDEYYLPECGMGGKEHYLHEELIYGYDDDKQILLSIGMNDNCHFSEIELSYGDIRRAYEVGLTCSGHGNLNWAVKNRIRVVSFDKLSGRYPYNPERFLKKIESYLLGKADEGLVFVSGFSELGDVYVGIGYYVYLLDEFEKIDRSKMFRHIHHLYEHKLMLSSSIRFMGQYENNPQILEAANEYDSCILSKMKELRMLSLKNKISETQQLRDRIRRLLIEIVDKEKAYLENFISCFSKENRT